MKVTKTSEQATFPLEKTTNKNPSSNRYKVLSSSTPLTDYNLTQIDPITSAYIFETFKGEKKTIGNTMYCKNGSATIVVSTVPNVCLWNFHVKGTVVFMTREDEDVIHRQNRVALFAGSKVDEPMQTDVKIYNFNKPLSKDIES